MNGMHGTTVICVNRFNKVAMAADGQITLNDSIYKKNANKLRKILVNEQNVLTGYAGSTSDALALHEKYEGYIKEFNGNIERASLALAREWRFDKVLRKLDAMLLTADLHGMLLISGAGDVIYPDDNILTIGSGGNCAKAAALAFMQYPDLSAAQIAIKSLEIASEISIYTNNQIQLIELP